MAGAGVPVEEGEAQLDDLQQVHVTAQQLKQEEYLLLKCSQNGDGSVHIVQVCKYRKDRKHCFEFLKRLNSFEKKETPNRPIFFLKRNHRKKKKKNQLSLLLLNNIHLIKVIQF